MQKPRDKRKLGTASCSVPAFASPLQEHTMGLSWDSNTLLPKGTLGHLVKSNLSILRGKLMPRNGP